MRPTFILIMALTTATLYAQDYVNEAEGLYPEETSESSYGPSQTYEELYTPAEIERQEEEELMDSLPQELGRDIDEDEMLDEY